MPGRLSGACFIRDGALKKWTEEKDLAWGAGRGGDVEEAGSGEAEEAGKGGERRRKALGTRHLALAQAPPCTVRDLVLPAQGSSVAAASAFYR